MTQPDHALTRQAGADRDMVVVHGDYSIDSGVQAGGMLLAIRRRPTAIFCFNDEMAIGVIEAARNQNIDVPRDLSVVGFDDIRFARHNYPALTTIASPSRCARSAKALSACC
jgi:LacI family transcriptional regulator, repressor for deo operon, udp, cdd, tsx, nupC, and nupG